MVKHVINSDRIHLQELVEQRMKLEAELDAKENGPKIMREIEEEQKKIARLRKKLGLPNEDICLAALNRKEGQIT